MKKCRTYSKNDSIFLAFISNLKWAILPVSAKKPTIVGTESIFKLSKIPGLGYIYRANFITELNFSRFVRALKNILAVL